MMLITGLTRPPAALTAPTGKSESAPSFAQTLVGTSLVTVTPTSAVTGDLTRRLPRCIRYLMGECIMWEKYKNACGYGVRGLPGRGKRTFLAHRVAFAEANGIDVDDIGQMCVLHSCDNPACVNPDHLRLGTAKDNSDDKYARGRAVHGLPGEKNVRAVLTEDNVLTIRSAAAQGASNQDLAAIYGVTHQCINLVVKRRSWSHV